MLVKQVVLLWQIYQCVQLEICIGPISLGSPGRDSFYFFYHVIVLRYIILVRL